MAFFEDVLEEVISPMATPEDEMLGQALDGDIARAIGGLSQDFRIAGTFPSSGSTRGRSSPCSTEHSRRALWPRKVVRDGGSS